MNLGNLSENPSWRILSRRLIINTRLLSKLNPILSTNNCCEGVLLEKVDLNAQPTLYHQLRHTFEATNLYLKSTYVMKVSHFLWYQEASSNVFPSISY